MIWFSSATGFGSEVACRRRERGSSGGSLRGIVEIDRRNGMKGGGKDWFLYLSCFYSFFTSVCASFIFINAVVPRGLSSNLLTSFDPNSAMVLKKKKFKSRLFIKKYFCFWKINSKKVNYFLMSDNVIENKLENTFQYLVISWKMSWKITY